MQTALCFQPFGQMLCVGACESAAFAQIPVVQMHGNAASNPMPVQPQVLKAMPMPMPVPNPNPKSVSDASCQCRKVKTRNRRTAIDRWIDETFETSLANVGLALQYTPVAKRTTQKDQTITRQSPERQTISRQNYFCHWWFVGFLLTSSVTPMAK